MHTVLLLAACLILSAVASEKKIVCYFYKQKVDLTSIDPSLCTHLIYSSDESGSYDSDTHYPVLDSHNETRDEFTRFNALRQQNPSLKTMLAMGAHWHKSSEFFHMASNATSRQRFVHQVTTFIKKWGFNGFEMVYVNWNVNGKATGEVQNFIELLKTLRSHFDREGLVLSTTVEANEISASRSPNIPEISKYLDFIILIGFSSPTSWEGWTAAYSPLIARFDDTARDKALSIESSVMYWLSHGAPRDKLIIALSARGLAMTLVDPNDNRIGAAARPTIGGITDSPGIVPYITICELHKSKDWTIVFDEEHRVSYTFKGVQWISYNNVRSTRERAEFIARLNLGGAMILHIVDDDFAGTCGPKYPLLKTLNAVLRGGSPVPEEPLPPVTTTPTPDVIPNSTTCTGSGYIRDLRSCGLIICVPNTAGDYDEYYLECSPGNCYHPIIGRTRAETVDYNFIVSYG